MSAYRTTGRPNFREEQRRAAARGTNEKPKWKIHDPEASLYPADWPAISAAIRQRDGYRCQIHRLTPGHARCAAYFPPPFSHYLHVHHKVPLPRGSNEPSNLFTLCTECHGEAHGRKFFGPSEKARRAAAKW